MNVGERYFLAGNDKSTSELYRAGKISKDDVEGHIVSAEMTPSGLVIYDHQKKSFVSIKAMLNDIDLKNGIEYFRIDNMLIDYGSPILAELVQAR